MEMLSTEEVRKRIRAAIETVKDIEDPYKIESFRVVLLHLLNYPVEKPAKRETPTKAPAPKRPKVGKPREKTTLRTDIIDRLTKLDDERFNSISRLKGRTRYFLLLKIAKDKGIDGLSSSEIEHILKERFMLPGIHETNVRRDLRKSTGFIEKSPLGKGHAFRIKKEGETFLSKELVNQ
jgi:hypothetical protein